MDKPDEFGAWLTGWNDAATKNSMFIGDAWPLGAQAIRLQVEAMKTLLESRFFDAERERALLLLGTHIARIESSIFALTVRGYFDTAAYLLRALNDAQSLLMGAICLDDSFVAELLEGKKQGLAAEARIALVNHYRRQGEVDLANQLEARFKGNNEAGNGTAHTQAYHLVRTLGPDGAGGWNPDANGFAVEGESQVLWAATLEIASWSLNWLAACPPLTADVTWQSAHDEFIAAEDRNRIAATAVMGNRGRS